MDKSESPKRWAGFIHLWSVLLELLARATVRRPWLFVALTLLSVVPTGYLASRLELKSSFVDLLSPSDPEVKDLNLVLDKTGGLGFSTIAISAADRPLAERMAVELERRLEAVPGVKFVQGRLDVDYLKDRQLYFLTADELKELTKSVKESIDYRVAKEADMLLDDEEPPPPDPFEKVKKEASSREITIEPFLVGNDGKYLYVLVGLGGTAGDLGETSRIQGDVERVALELGAELSPGLEILFTGPVVNRREDARVLGEDLSKAGLIGFAGVIVIMLGATRRKRSVILLTVPLAVGLAWTFAFAYLFVHHLNAVSGFLVSILSGLGIEYGVHLFKRYHEERSHGRDPEEATVRMLRSTGGALLGACLVNASVFAVVAVAGFRGFMEFGLIASAGMVLTMLATLLLFPALNYLVDRRWPVHVGPDRPMRPIAIPAWGRWATVVLVPVLGACSVWALSTGRVKFHTDWRELGSDTPAARFDAYIIKTLDLSVTQVMLYLEEPGDVEKVRAAVEDVRARRAERGLPFNFVRVIGSDDLVPRDQAGKKVEIDALAAQFARIKPSWIAEEERPRIEQAKKLAAAAPFAVDDLPKTLKQRFLTSDGKGTMAVITTDGLFEESSKLIDWSDQVAEMRAELANRQLKAALASENAIAGRIFRTITESGARILAAAFAVVFIVLVIQFHSLWHALAVLSSVAIGLLFTAGGMAVFDIELNFMNAAVLPIIVGVSVDNAIHIYHRFLESGPASIPMVLRQTGSAALLSSSANLAGFAALFVARNGGLRSVASLSVLGIIATVFTTTVIFPVALDWIGRRLGRARTDHEPMSG